MKYAAKEGMSRSTVAHQPRNNPMRQPYFCTRPCATWTAEGPGPTPWCTCYRTLMSSIGTVMTHCSNPLHPPAIVSLSKFLFPFRSASVLPRWASSERKACPYEANRTAFRGALNTKGAARPLNTAAGCNSRTKSKNKPKMFGPLQSRARDATALMYVSHLP